MVKEVTLNALNKWFKKTFEKLGWMVLALKESKANKIENYKKQVLHLKEALELKLSVLQEADRKRDIMIMLNDVKELEQFINTNLIIVGQSGGRIKKITKNKGSKLSQTNVTTAPPNTIQNRMSGSIPGIQPDYNKKIMIPELESEESDANL